MARILHPDQVVVDDLVRPARVHVTGHESQVVEAPVREAQQQGHGLLLVVHEGEVAEVARGAVGVVGEAVPEGERPEEAEFDLDLLAVVVEDVGVGVGDGVEAEVVEALLGAPGAVVAARELGEGAQLVVGLDEVLADGG